MRGLSVLAAVVLASLYAGLAKAGHSVWPLAWRTPPSRRYLVPLPRTWHLHVSTTPEAEIDTWLDPTSTGQKLVVTTSRCGTCVTKGGKIDPRAVIPRRASVTGITTGTATFVAHTPGDRYTEHGLVIVTRAHSFVTGSIVLQLWLPNVRAPGSENREWSYILANFSAKGPTKG